MNYRFRRFVTACALVALACPAAYSDAKTVAQGGNVLTAGNGYLTVHIQSTPGSGVGEFTVTDATGANVLFGGGHPGTSYTTIHSYNTNTDYVQGTGKSGYSIDAFGSVKPIGSTGFEVSYRLPGAPVTPDKMTIVQDIVVTGDAAEDTQVSVTTSVVDTGDTPEQIGVRYLWDYDLSGDDGPVLNLSTGGKASTETEVASTNATVVGSTGASAASGGGINPSTGPTPDSVQYVAWNSAYHTPFNYTVNPSQLAGGKDSAVVTSFGSTPAGAIAISPGGAASFSTSLIANPAADVVTIGVTPDVAVVGEEITFHAKSTGKLDATKIHWKASGGTPNKGDGVTFKTTYKSVGKKTVDVEGLGAGAPTSATVNVISVKFQIDGQTDANKSLVFIKNTVGVVDEGTAVAPLRLRTPCVAWVEGEPDHDIKITLTNPDGRILFTRAFKATHTLILPAAGDKVGFVVAGEKQSAAVGDAKIQALLDDKSKKLLGEQKATVFYLDPKLELKPEGTYVIAGGLYLPAAGKVGIHMIGNARALPATTDINAGVLARLNIGIAQNAISQNRTLLEDSPKVQWAANIEAGTKAQVPSTITRRVQVAKVSQDTVGAAADPLYATDTVRPNAAADLDVNDSPRTSATVVNIQVKDDTGSTVGIALYKLNQVAFDDHWRTWTVAYDPTSDTEYPLCEGTWDLVFNSKQAAAKQIATTIKTVAAVTAPLRGPDYTNDLLKPVLEKGPVVEIEQPGVLSVTLNPANVAGGTAVKGTIKLSAPAGVRGTPVNLGTNKPTVGKPRTATVTVPEGKDTVDFDIDTFAVAANTTVRIVGSCHNQAASAQLTVTK